MTVLLCRNRVADFSRWKAVFDSHAEAHRRAGLHLQNVWREVSEPNNVFFAFEVSDVAKAQAFVSDPAGADAGREAGVLDGEYLFVESAAGY